MLTYNLFGVFSIIQPLNQVHGTEKTNKGGIMKPRKIKDKIYWVGSVDWDRRLFDTLVPLPDGTSYNAYLIEWS